MQFLKDNRAKRSCSTSRPTSTIQADENAEKQRRSEFIGMLAQLAAAAGADDPAGAGDRAVLRRAAEVLGCAVPRRPHP